MTSPSSSSITPKPPTRLNPPHHRARVPPASDVELPEWKREEIARLEEHLKTTEALLAQTKATLSFVLATLEPRRPKLEAEKARLETEKTRMLSEMNELVKQKRAVVDQKSEKDQIMANFENLPADRAKVEANLEAAKARLAELRQRVGILCQRRGNQAEIAEAVEKVKHWKAIKHQLLETWLRSFSEEHVLAGEIFPLSRQITALDRHVSEFTERIAQLSSEIDHIEDELDQPELTGSIAQSINSIVHQKDTIEAVRRGVAPCRIVNYLDYLHRPLQEPKIPRNLNPTTTSEADEWKNLPRFWPNEVRVWDMRSCRRRASRPYVNIIDPSERPTRRVFDDETISFASYWGQVRDSVIDSVIKVYPEVMGEVREYSVATTPVNSGPGTCDEAGMWLKLPLYLLEARAAAIDFRDDVTVAEMVAEARSGQSPPQDKMIMTRNVIFMLIRLYSYLVNKKVPYGILTNWKRWAFVKIAPGPNGESILHVSRWYCQETKGEDSVRMAFASFLLEARRGAGAEFKMPPPGPPIASSSWLMDFDDEKGEESEKKKKNTVMTTKEFFRLEGLSLGNLPGKTLLSESTKSWVYRGDVGGRDLVWRIVDLYGTPRHSEWAYEDFDEMMEDEVKAYERLRAVQGSLIPEFVFRGSDFNSLWAVVTTYEGESLSKLASKGRLSEDVRTKARAALKALHDIGALHGDVALRNCVLRERDGAVLWVDLERCRFRDELRGGEEEFEERTQEEMSKLEAAFAWEDEKTTRRESSATSLQTPGTAVTTTETESASSESSTSSDERAEKRAKISG